MLLLPHPHISKAFQDRKYDTMQKGHCSSSTSFCGKCFLFALSLSLSISLLTIFMGYLTISFLQFSDHAIVKLEWHNICAICINSFSK